MKRAHAIAAVCLLALGAERLVPQRRPAPSAPGAEVRRMEMDYADEACDLEFMCGSSDTVAVGNVAGIFRSEHVPVNDPVGPMSTVYTFNVEQYLDSDGAPQHPPSLKVYIHGGTDETGTTLVRDGDPLLSAGDRYILFLKSHADGDLTAMYDGPYGVASYADEYMVAERIRGKLLLRNGITQVPADAWQTPDPWTWGFGGSGGTLLGLAEADAIAQIRQGIGQAAATIAAGAPDVAGPD